MLCNGPAGLGRRLRRGDPLRVSIPGVPAKPVENELPGFPQRLVGSAL